MQRKISPLERVFYHSPFAIVTMVARIKGKVTEVMLQNAVQKVQERHENLRVRIQKNEENVPFFTSEQVNEIPIQVMPKESDNQWINECRKSCEIPFEFEKRPAIRFILLQSPTESDLVILCHHIICDGLSLAYLARDLMIHLGDPNCPVKVLPPLQGLDKNSLPKEAALGSVANYFINRFNKKWRKNPIHFDQQDYLALNQAYWNNFTHQMVCVELSEEKTSALVERCRKQNVTVNTAITCAFVGAQALVQKNKFNPNLAVAASIRERLTQPAGENFGYFAGGVSLDYKCNEKIGFWDNCRKLQKKLTKLYETKNLFKELATWSVLESGIMEALPYKLIGGLVAADSPRYNKLSCFSKQDDAISSILKTQKMQSLEKPFLGTAITNLTRMNFPKKYGDLELDRLIMNPGGMFPLAAVNTVVGAVTCSGKLSLLIEHEEKTVSTPTMEKIIETALRFLME